MKQLVSDYLLQATTFRDDYLQFRVVFNLPLTTTSQTIGFISYGQKVTIHIGFEKSWGLTCGWPRPPLTDHLPQGIN